MKDFYVDWASLKKDAQLENAQDVSKDKGSASVSVGIGKQAVVHVYKQQDSSWVKQK